MILDEHNNGKSPFFIGVTSSNVLFFHFQVGVFGGLPPAGKWPDMYVLSFVSYLFFFRRIEHKSCEFDHVSDVNAGMAGMPAKEKSGHIFRLLK